MANISGFKPLANPEWISLDFDDGTSMAVQDPTGEYRAQIDSIAKKIHGVPPDPMKDATASLGGAVLGQVADAAGTAVKTATDAAPLGSAAPVMPALTPPASPVAPAVGGMAPAPSIVKTAMKGGAEQPAEPAAPGAPAPAASAPAPPTPPTSAPLVTTGTTSTWQRNKSQQTSGMADEDKAKVDAANEATADALETSNQADFASKATQYWNEFGRLSEQEKRQVAQRAVLQEQERKFDEAINAKFLELDETAARPVDPSQAFAGEKGWYAFMAGFGDVLRNVGSALAGQRPVADPGATLNALVERSVEMQMAQKKADYEQGKLSVDRLNADRETTRHRLGVVLQQLAATELGKAKTQEEYAALGALKAKGDAIVADARAKAAAATARQVVTSDSQVSGGGVTKGPAMGGTTAADILKSMQASRDIAQLQRSGLTQDEYDKQAADLAEKGAKQREFKDAVEEAAAAVGGRMVDGKFVPNEKGGEADVPTAVGAAASRLNPLGNNDWANRRQRAESAWARMKRADVMSMIREPSAKLQDTFAADTERPFFDSDIAGQLERLHAIASRADADIRAGKNPAVVQAFERAAGRAPSGGNVAPSLKPRGE